MSDFDKFRLIAISGVAVIIGVITPNWMTALFGTVLFCIAEAPIYLAFSRR